MFVTALILAQASRTVVIEGNLPASAAGLSTKSLRYLPFEVPVGTTRITIHKELDHGGDAKAPHIVDHGLFDPRGLNGKGFRGWMGGNSADIIITGDPATTATWFLAGPIPSGTWRLAQSYLQSTPAGVHYKYTIRFDFDGPKPPRRNLPLALYSPGALKNGPAWYAGDLHCHSLHSDGALTLKELANRHVKAGFDFMVSTEHNNTAAHYQFANIARKDLLLIAGAEVTTVGGHMNIIGQTPGYWLDFRMDPGDGKLPRLLDQAHRQGAIAEVNHPFADCTSCAWTFPASEYRTVNGIEIWNNVWDQEDETTLRWWDLKLRQGEHINAYGGADFHRDPNFLAPSVWVYAEALSQPAIMAGLRAGRTSLSANPKTPHLEMRLDGTSIGGTVKASSSSRLSINNSDGSPASVTVYGLSKPLTLRLPADLAIDTRQARYVRAERRDENGSMLALTNAIFIRK